MIDRDNWPKDLPQTGMTLYRPGEVMVLVESTSRATPDAHAFQRALEGFFGAIDYPLRPDTFKRLRDREPLRLSRRVSDPDRARPTYLQAVTLASTPRVHTHGPDRLSPSMIDVIRAVNTINGVRYSVEARKFLDDAGVQIAAATPNWLATAFCW